MQYNVILIYTITDRVCGLPVGMLRCSVLRQLQPVILMAGVNWIVASIPCASVSIYLSNSSVQKYALRSEAAIYSITK